MAYNPIIETFQDLRYIGELRQRWNEIKKLQNTPTLANSYRNDKLLFE